MKPRCVGIVCLLATAGAAQAAPPTKHHLVQKPISTYMRKVGLTYLEQLDDFKSERDKDQGRESYHATAERWNRMFSGMEDRITIDLSDGRRPSGDKDYFELLKRTRYAVTSEDLAYQLYNLALELKYSSQKIDSAKEDWKVWVEASSHCEADAHTFSLDGAYLDLGEESCIRLVEKADGRHRQAWLAKPAIVPKQEFTGDEAKARSWHTKEYCEKDGYVWGNDNICHAKDSLQPPTK